ncbi:2-C-methyl-D-erythritol 4-phosphate cytidylyltransferase [Candidatus Woesearchaeota archaeon]|nr:2-C-methyl-D-erythritol 4-phosphate cytidylyltransferase [Candidatus Woesearchaeota archaeon]
MVTAIILAAGSGERYGKPKVMEDIGGIPLLIRVVSIFSQVKMINRMIIVCRADDKDYVQTVLDEHHYMAEIIVGGKNRQESCYNGVSHALENTHCCSSGSDLVLIHDAARCVVTRELIERCIKTARDKGTCVPAIKVKDTIKRVNERIITEDLDRTSLIAVQTPQVFTLSDIKIAHDTARKSGFIGTDEASLMQRAGYTVHICEGDEKNIKLTTPLDKNIMEIILLESNNYCEE